MHPRAIEAVARCARTLAGTAGADLDPSRSGCVTLASLRAWADREALRRRFHDARVHAAQRPAGAAAAAIYDTLATARLDALGAAWLPGVARNLAACPGAEGDGLRWLAFECFGGGPAPRELAAAVDRARHAVAAHVPQLIAVGDGIAAPDRFARAAAAWAVAASGEAPDLVPPAASRRYNIPAAPGGPDVRRGRYARPGRTRDTGAEAPGDRTAGARGAAAAAAGDPVVALAGYRAYTTAFDRVVHAAALASRDELTQLRQTLDAEFAPLRTLVSRLAKRLMRVLMARQAREWRFDLEDGWIDAARLPAFIASRGAARPFRQEFESPFPSTIVSLLIDHSGSMKGRPMRIAALTVEVVARTLERCGVTCEVLGFTTRDWDGGEPARHWAEAGYPEAPGRLNALEHVVIKPADMPWRRARLALGLAVRDGMLKENIDGEALAWAHRRLLGRSERRRILIVISDGAPMDEATFAANGFDYLDGHLAAVVEHIESRSPVRLAAIGIGHDVSRFYRNATRIARMDDLGPALTAKLTALLDA